MFSYICNCDACDYCTLYNDRENWLPESSNKEREQEQMACPNCYRDENGDIEETCGSCSGNDVDETWIYEKLTPIDFIKKFHADDAEIIITKCNNVVKDFYNNIANNTVPDGAVDEFLRLCEPGCYIKQYFILLLKQYADKMLDINEMTRNGSVDTCLYYQKIIGKNDAWMLDLFVARRFDVLDAINATTNIIKFSNFTQAVLKHFCNNDIPISDDYLLTLATYYRSEQLIDACLDICEFQLSAELSKIKPAKSQSISNDPQSGDNTDNVQEAISRMFAQLSWDINTVTTSDITDIMTSSVASQLLGRVVKIFVPNVDDRKAKIYNITEFKFCSMEKYAPILRDHFIEAIYNISTS